jgi:hypothetical protein
VDPAGAALLGLFTIQFGLGFLNQADEPKDIAVLSGIAWV